MGRPRSIEANDRIARATLDLLESVGYERLSIEAVAARARVGKATVYRRYSGKAALVAATVRVAAGGPVDRYFADPDPENRPARAILEVIQRDAREALTNPGSLAIIATLLAHEQRNPDLTASIRSGVFVDRIVAVRELVNRGIASGEVRDSVAPDTVAALLFGSLVARAMLGAPLTDAWLSEVMDTIWNGLAQR